MLGHFSGLLQVNSLDLKLFTVDLLQRWLQVGGVFLVVVTLGLLLSGVFFYLLGGVAFSTLEESVAFVNDSRLLHSLSDAAAQGPDDVAFTASAGDSSQLLASPVEHAAARFLESDA